MEAERGNRLIQVKVTLRLTVGQSVCLGVEPRLGLMTRYLFLLKVSVLSVWGALSDERMALSFVRVIVCSIKSIASMYNYLHFTCYEHFYIQYIQGLYQSSRLTYSLVLQWE
jgi:hypothetical protein